MDDLFDFWQAFCIFVFENLKRIIMAILDNKGMVHGRVGDKVYQVQKGQQTMRSMPQSYHDKKSEEQLLQRDKMAAVLELYRRLRPAVKGCFELKKIGQRDYDRFKSLNLLNMNTISDGSLPTLNYRIINDKIECDIISKDWSKGDILRFICLMDERVEFENMGIDSASQTIIFRDVNPNGMYAFVHLRDGRKGRLASTQQLVANS